MQSKDSKTRITKHSTFLANTARIFGDYEKYIL